MSSVQLAAVSTPPGDLATTRDALDVRLEDIYRAELDWVYRTLRRLGGRPADLEDLTHDVFVAAHRSFERYDPSRPVRPWLFGIAFRVVSDYRSRARFWREQPTEDIEVPSTAGTPESELDRGEARELLLTALATLPLEQRAVFVASEIDETPMPELAEHLGISVNTLYSRLRLARARMAKAIRAMDAGGSHE